MDSGELAVIDAENEIVSAIKGSAVPVLANQYDDGTFGTLASSLQILPRLMLLQASSEPCKTGGSLPGHYGLIEGKNNLTKLGNECNILVINWRPKALDTSDRDNIVESNNPTSDDFKRIQAAAGESDSGCMFGPEFLVWIAQTQQFASFFCGSKTSRREAPQVKALMGKPATLKVQYIKGSRHSWHGSVVTRCSTPFELPDADSVIAMQQTFLNPPERTRESVGDEAGTVRAR